VRAKVFAVLVAIVSVSAVVSHSPSAKAAGLSFSTTIVSPEEIAGEPGLAVDGNTIYYVAPNLDRVLRSTDGGNNWITTIESSSTEGDADIAIDAGHNVYLSGLLGQGTLNTTLPVSVSTDGGDTWIRRAELTPDDVGITCDRNWTAASGTNHVVHTARCAGEVAWVSTDGGVTFSGPHVIDSAATLGGPISAAPDGSFVVAYAAGGTIFVARSTDGGVNWVKHAVGLAGGSALMFWPVVTPDDAGNLYVAWSSGNAINVGAHISENGHIFFSRSVDQGATWLAPAQISTPAEVAVFPWVSAGAAGKIDVSYYASTTAPVGPDVGSPVGTWDIVVAQSLDATSAAPTFTRSTAVTAFHTGSVCTSGLACIGPQQQGLGNAPTPFDRRVLDFFETALTADGSLLIAYPQDRPIIADDGSITVGDLFLSWVDLKLAKQTGGTKLRP